MPEYEFECRGCKKVFTLIMRLSERAAAKIRCPGCGSEKVSPQMAVFTAKTTRKS